MEQSAKNSKACSLSGKLRFEAPAEAVRLDAATLSLRIDLDVQMRIGPGKIELLEKIAMHGSISAAARAMDMSYRRAWILVDELDAGFGTPIVTRKTGGRNGGAARLTSLGLAIVERYRAVERAATKAARHHLAALQLEVERCEDRLAASKSRN